jgi:hypothetical protein
MQYKLEERRTGMNRKQLKSILFLLTIIALLATTGCIVPVDEGGHRHWEHWDRNSGYWDHHHDWDHDHR